MIYARKPDGREYYAFLIIHNTDLVDLALVNKCTVGNNAIDVNLINIKDEESD